MEGLTSTLPAVVIRIQHPGLFVPPDLANGRRKQPGSEPSKRHVCDPSRRALGLLVQLPDTPRSRFPVRKHRGQHPGGYVLEARGAEPRLLCLNQIAEPSEGDPETPVNIAGRTGAKRSPSGPRMPRDRHQGLGSIEHTGRGGISPGSMRSWPGTSRAGNRRVADAVEAVKGYLPTDARVSYWGDHDGRGLRSRSRRQDDVANSLFCDPLQRGTSPCP